MFVHLRYKSKVARCGFFIVPGDGPTLLGLPDIELLGTLKITCNVVEGQQAGRKFDSQTTKPTAVLNCEIHTGEDCRSDNMGIININPNMADCFRSSANIGQCRQRSQQINFTKNAQ